MAAETHGVRIKFGKRKGNLMKRAFAVKTPNGISVQTIGPNRAWVEDRMKAMIAQWADSRDREKLSNELTVVEVLVTEASDE